MNLFSKNAETAGAEPRCQWPDNLIAAGSFKSTGGVPAHTVSHYSPTTNAWAATGSGTSGQIRAFAAMPDGNVLVGGNFTTVGGTAANRIARYNPTTGAWSALGAGFAASGPTSGIFAFAILPDGSVVVGGRFDSAAGVSSSSNVARYNPTTGLWSTLGNGTSGQVNALAVLPGGDVIVGGSFLSAGGVSANRIARYSPSTGVWSALGAGVDLTSSPAVNALIVLPGGDLIVGGSFTRAGGLTSGVNYVARYNPTTGAWSGLSTPSANGIVNAFAVLTDALAGSLEPCAS